MAGTYAVVEFAFEVGLAAAAHRVSPWLQRSGRRFNQACGAVFVLIGAGLPLRG
jgi:threonine/homoserine/homoserine lactone efflux protein